MRLFITARAARDLDTIADWTLTHWGRARMERYLRHLDQRMEALKFNPKLGQDRSDMSLGLRCLPAKSHLIFYLVTDACVSIVAVLHQSMDVAGRFG